MDLNWDGLFNEVIDHSTIIMRNGVLIRYVSIMYYMSPMDADGSATLKINTLYIIHAI